MGGLLAGNGLVGYRRNWRNTFKSNDLVFRVRFQTKLFDI